MRRLLAAALALGMAGGQPAAAGEAENIAACIAAVKDYTGRAVDEFNVRYEGSYLSFSVAEWEGVRCEVKLASVWNLEVDGEPAVDEGFAGRKAKELHQALELETDQAISTLEARIGILERRLEEAEAGLRKPQPDLDAIGAHVREGIEKAL